MISGGVLSPIHETSFTELFLFLIWCRLRAQRLRASSIDLATLSLTQRFFLNILMLLCTVDHKKLTTLFLAFSQFFADFRTSVHLNFKRVCLSNTFFSLPNHITDPLLINIISCKMFLYLYLFM